jgi:hypothetical protein
MKYMLDLGIVLVVTIILTNVVFSGSTTYVVERIERMTQVMEG